MTYSTSDHGRDLCPWVAEALPVGTLPEWVRTTLVAANGAMFVPAAIAPGGETAVILNSMHDRLSPVRFRGHAFVSVQWLRCEYPQRRNLLELLDLIERRVQAATAEAAHGSQEGTSLATGAACHG